MDSSEEWRESAFISNLNVATLTGLLVGFDMKGIRKPHQHHWQRLPNRHFSPMLEITQLAIDDNDFSTVCGRIFEAGTWEGVLGLLATPEFAAAMRNPQELGTGVYSLMREARQSGMLARAFPIVLAHQLNAGKRHWEALYTLAYYWAQPDSPSSDRTAMAVDSLFKHACCETLLALIKLKQDAAAMRLVAAWWPSTLASDAGLWEGHWNAATALASSDLIAIRLIDQPKACEIWVTPAELMCCALIAGLLVNQGDVACAIAILELLGTPADDKRKLRSKWLQGRAGIGAADHDIYPACIHNQAEFLMFRVWSAALAKRRPREFHSFLRRWFGLDLICTEQMKNGLNREPFKWITESCEARRTLFTLLVAIADHLFDSSILIAAISNCEFHEGLEPLTDWDECYRHLKDRYPPQIFSMVANLLISLHEFRDTGESEPLRITFGDMADDDVSKRVLSDWMADYV